MTQLKKSTFLETVTDEPMSREQLVDALSNFDFISSYLDYLTDHYIALGKIIKNEDGTIQRRVKVSSNARILFRVIKPENGTYVIEEYTLADNEYYTDERKKAGWATTVGAAVKKASSKVFQEYKAEVAVIKAKLTEFCELGGDEEDIDTNEEV